MNQYRCETCSHYLKNAIACNKIKERLICGADEWIEKVGCASHSDFQNQREKILDELESKRKEYENHLNASTSCFNEYDRGLIEGKGCFCIILKEWIKELRGEQ